MRKFTFTLGMICTIALASFVGGCNRNSDTKCSGDGACCKDKAAGVRTDAQATPAASGTCTKTGSCSGKCTGEKKVCPMTGQSN